MSNPTWGIPGDEGSLISDQRVLSHIRIRQQKSNRNLNFQSDLLFMGKAEARTYWQSRMAQCSQGDSHMLQFPCCTVPRWHRARRSSGSLVPTGHLGNLEKKHNEV